MWRLFVEIGASLTALALKGTVSAVSAKIKAMKMEKDVDSIRNRYEEIINEILSEREEAIRIAQMYKSELERYEISDEDIQHLHSTISRMLRIASQMSPASSGTAGGQMLRGPINTLEQIQELISIDTLKAMQLLGFNYKAAIGEPLTQLCADAIRSLRQGQAVSTTSKGSDTRKRK